MIYNDFCGERISRLGMGLMRLPVTEPRGPIDEAAALEMIDKAYQNGVNYFDTAYRYHGGASETFIGKALKRYPRDSWYLASKMPGHMMNYTGGKLGYQGYLAGEPVNSIDDIFLEQLNKCGVEYFDYYLLHNVCETSFDFYTNAELGVVDYFIKQKSEGRARRLGFSSHAHADTISAFLDKYPGVFEFVQIQVNYLDWALQDAGAKYDAIAARGLQLIAMEPCRGGALAKLSEVAEARFKSARPNESIAAWAFRYLISKPEIRVILSGMTTLEQVEDNLRTFGEDNALTPEELKLVDRVRDDMLDIVPCTKCRYCCDVCPQNLDIPKLITMYSVAKADGVRALSFNIDPKRADERPGACLSCGACKQICPQGIDIPDIMTKFAEMLK